MISKCTVCGQEFASKNKTVPRKFCDPCLVKERRERTRLMREKRLKMIGLKELVAYQKPQKVYQEKDKAEAMPLQVVDKNLKSIDEFEPKFERLNELIQRKDKTFADIFDLLKDIITLEAQAREKHRQDFTLFGVYLGKFVPMGFLYILAFSFMGILFGIAIDKAYAQVGDFWSIFVYILLGLAFGFFIGWGIKTNVPPKEASNKQII